MNKTCAECGDSEATLSFKTQFETIPVCLDCFNYLDNYDGPADTVGEPPPSLDELHQKAFRQKYYGEGL